MSRMGEEYLRVREIADAEFAARVEAIEECAVTLDRLGESDLAHVIRQIGNKSLNERLGVRAA